MRLSSIAAWSVAVALAIGPAMADSRDDGGAAIPLGWSSSGISFGTGAPADSRSDGLAPDLRTRFPGYALQTDPNFQGLLAGEQASAPAALLFQSAGFVGSTIALASDLHLHLGAASTRPDEAGLPPVSNFEQLQLSRAAAFDGSRTLLAGADWDVASWGGLGIAAAQFAQPAGGFAASLGSEFPNVATMFGVSAHLNFGDGWITSFSYDEGRTQFDLRPDALSLNNDTTSRMFDFTISKADLFGGDALGLSWVRPVQPSDSVLLAPQISLSSTPESDFQLDYETSFNGNVTLQANAGYQMNVGGQNGTKAISVLSRAKINF